ncbi:MAG TPA: tripartite tricarboxylate transporter substrate binding protein [Burkholderiales bacterium]|nr:tripartite tricarboxylate transporter substrate binding protein [Burkholderiales bacterium]
MKTLLVLLAVAASATAQDFPTKPIRLVVPNPAGGTVDIVARVAAQQLTAALGQNAIVEIKPGGNNVIGSEIVARAPADGHTVLMIGNHFVINPLVRKLPYDGMRAFTPIAGLAATPLAFAVNPAVPARSLQELVAYSKSKPGLNYASSTTGSGIHLAGEMFKSLAGIDLNTVPYQGGVQAAMAVAGGHADVLVAPLSDAAPHLASGRLRVLAVSSPQRVDLAKDIPTVAESGYPGFQAQSWFGAVAPAGTPQAVVNRLAAEMLRAVEKPEVKATFAKLGIVPLPMGPREFGAFMRAEQDAFAKIIKDGNIRPE